MSNIFGDEWTIRPTWHLSGCDANRLIKINPQFKSLLSLKKCFDCSSCLNLFLPSTHLKMMFYIWFQKFKSKLFLTLLSFNLMRNIYIFLSKSCAQEQQCPQHCHILCWSGSTNKLPEGLRHRERERRTLGSLMSHLRYRHNFQPGRSAGQCKKQHL